MGIFRLLIADISIRHREVPRDVVLSSRFDSNILVQSITYKNKPGPHWEDFDHLILQYKLILYFIHSFYLTFLSLVWRKIIWYNNETGQSRNSWSPSSTSSRSTLVFLPEKKNPNWWHDKLLYHPLISVPGKDTRVWGIGSGSLSLTRTPAGYPGTREIYHCLDKSRWHWSRHPASTSLCTRPSGCLPSDSHITSRLQ